jgi:hypothetical protein
MMSRGVETPSRRDQFAGSIHAQQHRASGLAVIAGALQDAWDRLGSVAVVQEVEDGLANELSVVPFPEPVDGGDTCFRGNDMVGQDGWLCTEACLVVSKSCWPSLVGSGAESKRKRAA